MSPAQIHPLERPSRPPAFDTALLETLPVAVLICDVQTRAIVHANSYSRRLAEALRHVLPVLPEQLVGAPLGVFGVDLSAGLPGTGEPLQTETRLGGETLSFLLTVGRNGRGTDTHIQAVWSVETKAAAERTRYRRLRQMVEQMPINVMTCDRDGFIIDYANRTSLETLHRIEQHLPIKASELIGSSIDIFHKCPEAQRSLLSDSSRLPHNTRIKVGPETLDLKVSALTTPDGAYDSPMLTWALVTDAVNVANSVTAVVEDMSRTSASMEKASAELNHLATESEQMTSSVAAAAVEMSVSFREVSQHIHSAASMTAQAAGRATSANGLVEGLVESIERIGNVSALIERIASQTNLLALNAAIEAARVGEAGKGFAVVASEVKQLALQTANATKDINHQVETVQRAGTDAARAVEEITQNVGDLRDVFSSLSAAIEEQTATNESVSESINSVSRISGKIVQTAGQVDEVSGSVSTLGERLREEMKVLIAG